MRRGKVRFKVVAYCRIRWRIQHCQEKKRNAKVDHQQAQDPSTFASLHFAEAKKWNQSGHQECRAEVFGSLASKTVNLGSEETDAAYGVELFILTTSN